MSAIEKQRYEEEEDEDDCLSDADSSFPVKSSYNGSALKAQSDNLAEKFSLLDTGTESLVTVDRAPTQLRPFADIPNPYDHACSVLCNHPYGIRLNWFARRFIWLSRMTTPWSGDSLKRLISAPTLLPPARLKQEQTGKGGAPKAEVVSPDRKSGKGKSTATTSSSGVAVKMATQLYATVHPQKWKVIQKVKGKVKRHDIGKIGKKKRTKRGKARKLKCKVYDEQTTEGNQEETEKSKKTSRKTHGGRRGFPVSREEVDDPVTLVEDDAEGASRGHPTRHRRERVFRISGTTSGLMDILNAVTGSEPAVGQDQIQQQLDEEVTGSEYDPKRLQELQRLLEAKSAESSRAQTAKELQNMSEEISKNLPKAMTDNFGEWLDPAVLDSVLDLSNWNTNSNVDFNNFVGLAALAERFICSANKTDSANAIKDRIEELDFRNLSVYLEDIQIPDNVRSLLNWIKDS